MEGVKTIENYIAFMDLLGTKAMAAADSEQYRYTIEAFHKIVNHLCNEYKSTEVYVFSDCAYFQESQFERFCMFFKDMREKLLEKEICFSAAICKGTLQAKKSGKKKDKFIIVDFLNNEVVNAYSLQSRFTGAGICIDPDILKNPNCSVLSEQLLIDSVYANISKSDGKLVFKKCKDIRFQRSAESLLQFILNLYVKTYILDRRAARYYYTIYATYIGEQEIATFLDDDMKLITTIIDSIKKICDFDGKKVIIFLLINRLYNAWTCKNKQKKLDEVNEELYDVLSYIYENMQMDQVYNIREVSSEIISDTNKLLFADFLIMKIRE